MDRPLAFAFGKWPDATARGTYRDDDTVGRTTINGVPALH